MSDRNAREFAMKRRYSHMAPEARKVLEASADWYATNRFTGETVTGTIKQIKAKANDDITD